MPCFRLIDAWPAPPGAPNRRPVFSPLKSYSGAKAFSIPCGRCNGCLDDKARDWGIRCAHEAQMMREAGRGSSFLLCSIRDEDLPADMSLDPLLIKNFIRRVAYECGETRYILCGEYGDRRKRPHYHVGLFGEDFFHDRKPWKKTDSGFVVYRSELAERLWPYGFVHIGELVEKSAAYIARYTMKAARPNGASLTRYNEETGETWEVHPQFLRMSRMPGIGASWFDKYWMDCSTGYLIHEGRKVPIPAYYLDLLERRNPALAEKLRMERLASALLHVEENSTRRAMTREEVKRLRLATLGRSYDEGEAV